MGKWIFLIWLVTSLIVMWPYWEVFEKTSFWKTAVATVLLTTFAPVIFLCDIVDLIVGLLILEDEG